LNAGKSGTASVSTPLLPDEYGKLIEGVRETANAMVPRNATVLVVSRGDEELLRIGPRRALHFPQDEFGRYAGYHPEDSDAAIAALEQMRARGGEYLLLPSTSFWWLEYYEGLRKHLEQNYPAVASTEDCMVFELLATGAQPGPGDADTHGVSAATQIRQLAAPLDDLLRALLPADAVIAVAATGDGELTSFTGARAVHLTEAGDGVTSFLAAAGDAEFAVIPATAYDRLYGSGAPPDSVGPWRLVTRQRHMCEVWERVGEAGPPPHQAVPPPAAPAVPAPAAAGSAPPAGRPGLWQRILGLFRHR
jgi:hypothetical protein